MKIPTTTLSCCRTQPALLAAALLLAGCALTTPAHAQTGATFTDATSGYFDASSGTRSFVVTAADLAGGAAVNSVTFSVDFEKYDGEVFGVNAGGTPFYNEIVFTLTNPNNVTTTLIGAGAFTQGANGFRGTITFDDAAADVVNVDPNSPQAGTFRPSGGMLSSLNVADGIGTWTLGIQDTTGSDHLGYYSSTLNLNGGAAATAVPEPSEYAVGGLFGATLLFGMVKAWRKASGNKVSLAA